MEQVDQLEVMHEQRVELLTRSIRKVVQSKKRRREEGAEEVGGVSGKRGPLCVCSVPLYVHTYVCVCVCVHIVCVE